jgi:succinate-acetate transporter protein
MSQRRALGVLFGVIAVALLGIALAAIDDAWPVAFAAGVLGLWMGTMAFRALAR